ncbi:MAG: MBL fold metallo-hydrolase, partial [Polyangia bacterium]
QGGSDNPPVTSRDILAETEAFRSKMDYFSHSTRARPMLARLAAIAPRTLACMHGSAWQGDGAALLGALGDALDGRERR